MKELMKQYATFVDGVTSLPSKNNWAFSNRIEELNMEGFDFSRFMTGSIGMIAEVSEFLEEYNQDNNSDSLAAEIGDLYWYITNTAISLGGNIDTYNTYDVKAITVVNTKDIVDELIIHTGRFLDEAKKVAFHGKPINDKLDYFKEKLSIIIALAGKLANIYDNVDNIILSNIAKLESRYPGGKFSIERSENRVE